MTDRNNNHTLYHEAKRRATLAQPIQRYTLEKKLLLSAPNNIITEIFNTIIKDISNEKFFDYISNNLIDYLVSNWSSKIIQRIIKRLKREQAVDLRAGLTNIPLIGYSSTSEDRKYRSKKRRPTNSDERSESSREMSDSKGKQKSPPIDYVKSIDCIDRKQILLAARQIYEHVMWRIKSDNVTQITSLLIKQTLDDGYKTSNLKSEVFDDVVSNLETWRSQMLIKFYAFGDAPADDQKLILSSTNRGNLSKWFANYIDGSEKRKNPDLIKKLASALRDRTKNCIYLTNDIHEARRSLQTEAIRLVIVVDRLRALDHFDDFETLMKNGKLYIVDSLDCIMFAPDPTNETCC